MILIFMRLRQKMTLYMELRQIMGFLIKISKNVRMYCLSWSKYYFILVRF